MEKIPLKYKKRVEESLAILVSTLHRECLLIQLITKRQWNEEIAPKLKELGNVINGLKKDSPTARQYKAPTLK